MIEIIKKKISNALWFVQCCKFVCREQKVKAYLSKNSKYLQIMQKADENASGSGKLKIPPSKKACCRILTLGFSDEVVLYRLDAARVLQDFTGKNVPAEKLQFCTCSTFHNWPESAPKLSLFWEYDGFFVEVGDSINRHKSRIGFIDKRLYQLRIVKGNQWLEYATQLENYGYFLHNMPKFSLKYVFATDDVLPLRLVYHPEKAFFLEVTAVNYHSQQKVETFYKDIAAYKKLLLEQ